MSPSARPFDLDRNLRSYGAYMVASRALFWLPTASFHFLAQTGLAGALQLHAVYFLSVVCFEVPSGWASDRWGRVPVLRAAALAWLAAHAVFVLLPASFAWLALAQVLVALGWALQSGSDVTLHYDSLQAADRATEFERREGRASRNAFLATMVAALVGGSLALVDLRLPFAAALVAAVAQLAAALRMREPPMESTAEPRATAEPGALRSCLLSLRRPQLAWLFLFMAVQQPLEGLALDLIPPWLTLVTGASFADAGKGPLIHGALVAALSAVGAVAAARAAGLRARFGLVPVLVGLASVEALLLLGLAAVRSPWLLGLLLLRSTQAAAAPVLVAAAVAPHLARHHRATFLSLGSLAGRLLYGVVLVALGWLPDTASTLWVGAAVGAAGVAALLVSRARLRGATADTP